MTQLDELIKAGGKINRKFEDSYHAIIKMLVKDMEDWRVVEKREMLKKMMHRK